MDSGATNHYTIHRDNFTLYQPLKYIKKIKVGNRDYIDAIGVGTVYLKIIVNN